MAFLEAAEGWLGAVVHIHAGNCGIPPQTSNVSPYKYGKRRLKGCGARRQGLAVPTRIGGVDRVIFIQNDPCRLRLGAITETSWLHQCKCKCHSFQMTLALAGAPGHWASDAN